MRHRRDHRKLSRTASHRKALLRNLVTALFEYERIETTVAKAKETRRLAERMITFAKRASQPGEGTTADQARARGIHARRMVARVVRSETIVKKLFDDIAPLYATRPGGYTRILKTRRRLGDAGEMGILELVKSAEQKAEARRKRDEAKAAAAPTPKKKGLLDRLRGGDKTGETEKS